MGTLVGHVATGIGFLVIGLWHLLSHIMLYARTPGSYKVRPWFPLGRFRHLELYLIIIGSSIFIALDLFIGRGKGQPLDDDWTIPSYHLHNFEHGAISFTFITYAALAVALDRFSPPAGVELTFLVLAVSFSQQLFVFHLHSSDHMGVEGQYHLLLQAIIVVALATSLMGISFSESFIVGFVRSASVFFQGVWLIVMGFVLWTPRLVFKGCFMNREEGNFVVRCNGEEALHRAKSLVNIQFSWCLAGVVIFSVVLYLVLAGKGKDIREYANLETEDLEMQIKVKKSPGMLLMK